MIHTVKTWKEYYRPQELGVKLFELRKDDRNYKVGDLFFSQEYDPDKNEYTGNEQIYRIVYVLRDAEMFGLKEGYCILQLRKES